MDKIKTSFPAFPRPMAETSLGGNFEQDGMSLRDYFAAKAMSGWLASYGPEDAVKVKNVAEFAYEIADAMIEARGETNA